MDPGESGNLVNGRAAVNPRLPWIVAAMLAVALIIWSLHHWFGSGNALPMDPQYTQLQPERVALINGMQSYDSIATVTQRLQATGLQPGTESSHLPAMKNRPPYDFDTLSVEGASNLGLTGSMVLEFFNDRLYSVTFRPDSEKAYLVRIRRENLHLRRTHPSVWEATEGNLRIYSNADFAISDEGRQLNDRLFVTWEDTRLTAQISHWYESYGLKGTLLQK